MAKIDILLPFWGDVELFKRTVKSVLLQTESDWRLVIADDYYPSDEPAEFIKQLNDKRISYIRHAKNIGITNNFNFLLHKATSQYCVLVGCDDLLLTTYIETALKNIGDADFYQPAVEVIDEKGNIYLPLGDNVKRVLRPKKAGIYSGEKLAASLCHGNWLYFPSITWKSEVIQKYSFDSKYKIAEDLILELNLIKDGAELYLDNTPTFQYRRFAQSLSSKEKGKDGVRFKEEAAVYKDFSETFQKMGWDAASRAARLRITSRIHQLMS